DDAVDTQRHRQVDRRPKTSLRIVALCRIWVKEVAGGVHRAKPEVMLRELPRQAITLLALPDRGEVKMRARPWSPCANAQLDIGDAVLGAPGKDLAAFKLGERV